MRVCYVITGGPATRYAAMLRLSIGLLRRTSPDAPITVLADPATADALDAAQLGLDRPDDALVPVTTDFDDARAQSRAIKTQVGRHVETPHVFLDVDTAPVAPIAPLFERPAPLAIARDIHPLHWRLMPELFARAGWTYRPGAYFNSGVLLVGDAALSDRLYTCWHEHWRHSHERGLSLDQPALNHTLRTEGIVPAILPPRYNAMIRERMREARNAHVIHYYADDLSKRRPTMFDHAVRQIAAGEATVARWCERILADPHPWPAHPPLARRLLGPARNGTARNGVADALHDAALELDDDAVRGWPAVWAQWREDRRKRAHYFETEAWSALAAGHRGLSVVLMARSLWSAMAVPHRWARVWRGGQLTARAVGIAR